jgi:hypothetical protein
VAVLELAANRLEATDERLAGLVPDDLDDRSKAALGDALAALAEIGDVRVLERSDLPPGDRIAIDLEADLPGGGIARLAAECRRGPDGLWRLACLGGPGVEWPRRSPIGEGVSISANPQ